MSIHSTPTKTQLTGLFGILGLGLGVVGVAAAFFVCEVIQLSWSASSSKYQPQVPAIQKTVVKQTATCTGAEVGRWLGCSL